MRADCLLLLLLVVIVAASKREKEEKDFFFSFWTAMQQLSGIELLARDGESTAGRLGEKKLIGIQ